MNKIEPVTKRQRVTLDVHYDPKMESEPATWNWAELTGQSVSVAHSGPAHDFYPTVHINDPGAFERLSSIPWLRPRVVKLEDDCGSVWGEAHHDCPTPHVLLKSAGEADLAALRWFGIGYSADTTDEWGSGPIAWRWMQYDRCDEYSDGIDRRTVWRDERNEVE